MPVNYRFFFFAYAYRRAKTKTPYVPTIGATAYASTPADLSSDRNLRKPFPSSRFFPTGFLDQRAYVCTDVLGGRPYDYYYYYYYS